MPKIKQEQLAEAPQSPPTERGFFYGYVVVLAALVIMTVTYLTTFTYGVFFKPLIDDFGCTRAMMSGAFSVNNLSFGLANIITGRLTDRIGPRLVITACGLLFGLGYWLMSQVGAVWQLYLFLGVIAGVGTSGGMTPLSSTVGRWFQKRRGLMMGIVTAGIGIGTVIGPPVATWLISSHGWRTAYVILSIIILVCIIVPAQFLKRDPAQMKLLPYGATEATSNNAVRQNSNPGAKDFSLNEAFKTKQFWMLMVISFSVMLTLLTILVHIVPYATDIDISTAIAASFISVLGIALILGQLSMGTIADRIGSRLSLTIGFALLAAALFFLLTAKGVWALYLFAALFGLGQGGLAALLPLATAELFGLSSHGAIFGIIIFGGTVGGTIGPVLAGWIFDIYDSYSLAFIIMAMLAVVALVLTFWVKKPPRSKEGNLG